MSHCDKPLLAIAALAAVLVPAAACAQAQTPSSGIVSLAVRAHPGAQSIDVTGNGPISRAVTITLVSTLSRDLPDVVLSRNTVTTDARGAFATTVPIAPGFLPGSIITVYATTPGGAPAAKAPFSPDAPNRGVAVPFDELPRSIR